MVAIKEDFRAKVAELLDAGMPVARIADKLGISRQRVYKIADALGYKFERIRLKTIPPVK